MPGLYQPSAGDVLTAANAIGYWSKQVVIQAASGTRPASPVEGMVIYETDTDALVIYNGAAWVQLTPEAANVATSQTTTSTSYTDLATSGPAVTIQTGTKAFVTVSAHVNNSLQYGQGFVSFAVSGATTLAAADDVAFAAATPLANIPNQASRVSYLSALTAGSNVFTVKYRVVSGTGTFIYRYIIVEPIP